MLLIDSSGTSILGPQVLKAIDSMYTDQHMYQNELMRSLASPWNAWNSEEGKNFLRQLKDWEEKNPSINENEMSVKGVLEKIRSKVVRFGGSVVNSDLAQEFLEMIPNDPFPVCAQ